MEADAFYAIGSGPGTFCGLNVRIEMGRRFDKGNTR